MNRPLGPARASVVDLRRAGGRVAPVHLFRDERVHVRASGGTAMVLAARSD